MSRPFWIVTGLAASGTAVLVNRWADTRTDAAIIVSIFTWATFFLAIIDVYRTRRS